jgi:hypothetical protein
MGVGLDLIYDDLNARNLAQELLPTVRVAARLASAAADERDWAEATIAECALHENLLAGSGDPDPVAPPTGRLAYNTPRRLTLTAR